jgi:phage terminase large subunit
MQASVLFKRNYQSTAQVVVNQGGTNSGKTFAITQVLFCLACEQKKQIITVAGQDVPNLKVGALRDALTIYNNIPEIGAMVRNYNKSDRVFEFKNGSIIEFKSYDNAQDAKSGKRDYLFVNEANGVDYNIYAELALRTKKRVFIDYNPNSAFWVHERLLGQTGVELIISDHRHNPFLPQATRDKIELLRSQDIELWKVYARGLTGKINELILDNWHICEAIPPDARPLAAGLDFGFTNDETGCLMVYQQNGELWVNELLYENNLTNPDISARLMNAGLQKDVHIIADSAEPKSIEELKRLGWRITGAKKGADSIKNSIDILRRYRINVTRQSVNLRNELKRYKWKVDRSGRVLNEPVDSYNHLIDPLRYVALNKLRINKGKGVSSWLPNKSTPSDQATGQLGGMLN